MAEGTDSVGAVYLDLIIRDTIQQQLDKIVGKAGAAAQRGLGDAGKQAGKAFAEDFDRGAAAAELAVKRLKKQAAGLSEQLDGIAETKLQEVAGMFPDAGSRNAYVEQALAGDKAYQKLQAQVERVDQQIEAAQDRLSVAVQAAQDKQARAAEAAAEQAASSSEKAATRTRRAAQRAVDTVRQAANAGLSAVKKAAGGITGLASKAASGLQKSWQTAAGKVGRIFSTIGRTARRVFVLGSILAFFNGMKSAMQGAIQQNDQLAASLARIKGSLATAFSAVFTAAMPALQALMNGLAALAARLASFVTALFGTTVSKAGAAAKKLTAVGSGADKAAKKLQGALAGFDELNVLQQQEDAGGSGGADAGGYDFGGIADGGASAFGEQLRALFLAQDWDGIGRLLGEKVNGLVDSFDAVKWGTRLGRAVQAGIAILWRFIETVDWNNIGRKLGEFFTMALAQIDGWKLGQLLTAKWKIGFEILQGFIETFDFALLGRQLSNGIKGALENLTDAVQAVDWYGFGKKIEEALCSIDWEGVFTAAAEFAGSCLGAVCAFFWGLFEDAWNGLQDYFNSFIEQAGGNVALGLLNGIVNALANINQWITEHIFTPFMNAFKKVFGIHSPSTVMAEMGQYVVAGVLQGITGSWATVTAFFVEALNAVQTLFSDAWTALQENTAALWEGICSTIKGAVNSIIGLINGLVQAAANGVNAVIDELNSLSFDVPDWVPLLGGSKFGFSLPHVSAPKIPLLANGGVIEQPTLAMMGEYQGAGRNPEIAAPEDKLRGIFAEGLTPLLELLHELLELLRDGGDQEIVIRFAASGGLEQLVRLMLPYIDKEQTRVGARLVTGGVY